MSTRNRGPRRSELAFAALLSGLIGGVWAVADEVAAPAAKSDAPEEEQGSSYLRRIREASEPILTEMAEKHGYHLAPGQTIGRVAPPFPDLRKTYYKVSHPSQSDAIPRGPQAMAFRWENDKLTNWGMTFGGGEPGGYSVSSLLDTLFEIKPQRVEGDAALLATEVPGDWIVRNSPDVAAGVEELERILQKDAGLDLRLTFRDVPREVYVAAGDYQFQPQPGQKAEATIIYTDRTAKLDPIDIFGKERVPDSGAGGGTGNLEELLEWTGRWIACPIVSEVGKQPTRELTWRLHEQSLQTDETRGEAHDPELVLANLSAQTGLTFRKEKRPLKILFVEPTR